MSCAVGSAGRSVAERFQPRARRESDCASGQSPVKTVGGYWPYATTVFDYIRRAMPFNAPKSLTDDEVYAVTAYILNLNGVVGDDDVLDAQSLPRVSLPNREGFVRYVPGR